MPDFKQIYKNRADAYRDFIAPQNLPVKRAAFYEHCLEEKIIQADKSLLLSDLLAYVQKYFNVTQDPGQSLAERQRAENRAKREDEEQELRLKRLRREEAKASGRTIDIDQAGKVVRRKILVIYDRIKAQFRRDQEDMLYRLGLPPNQAAALMVEIVGCIDRAFLEMRSKKEFSVMILEEEDGAE